MRYQFLLSTGIRREAVKRRLVATLVVVWLNCRLPVAALTLLGRVTGNKARARIAREVVEFVSNPTDNYKKLVCQWALSYANPGIVKKLIRSVSKLESDDWRFWMLNQADPHLLLTKEHNLPAYQEMQISSTSPKTALVCFADNGLSLNMPVQLFHCTVIHRFDLLIYLRDTEKQCYVSGVRGMGTSLDELIDGVRQRIPANCDVSVVSTSGGGIAASRFAESIHARRLALFSPAFKHKGTNAIDPGGPSNVGAVKVFFAGGNKGDQKFYALWESNIADNLVEILDTDTHGTLEYLAAIGRLDSILDWLATS